MSGLLLITCFSIKTWQHDCLFHLGVMNCIVTAGPTCERLDNVRRLTNFSTGRLGTELAGFLMDRGHEVTLLVGEQSTYHGQRRAKQVETFNTTADLHGRLEARAGSGVEAVFHSAAVSDFTFGKIWHRSQQGELTEIKAGKISTRQGTLLAELVPTPKIIAGLRGWFPKARLVGWKYEVDGDRAAVIAAAEKQIRECLTDACVANGPAYGEGFGVVTANGTNGHVGEMNALFEALAQLLVTAK
jgi:phosphopantothenate---cysteine ligase (CTP)